MYDITSTSVLMLLAHIYIALVFFRIRTWSINRFLIKIEAGAMVQAWFRWHLTGKDPTETHRLLYQGRFLKALPDHKKMLFSFKKLTIENWFSPEDQKVLFGIDIFDKVPNAADHKVKVPGQNGNNPKFNHIPVIKKDHK